MQRMPVRVVGPYQRLLVGPAEAGPVSGSGVDVDVSVHETVVQLAQAVFVVLF